MEKQANKKLLNVPFYINEGDGTVCYRVAMQSVLKYFLGKEYSLNELIRLTDKKPGKWTSTTQIVPALHDLGLNLMYFTKSDPEPYLRGEPYIREIMGKDADEVLKSIDIDGLVNSIKKVRELRLAKVKVLTVKDIADNLSSHHVPLVLLDWSKINNTNGPYHGHFGVLTGFDKEHFYFHDSGPTDPTPNKPIRKELFLEAWNSIGTDNDMIIVYGKR